LFDIRKPLLPLELYEPIKCKQAGKFVVAPIICVHDLDKDIWVSAFIWNNGSFEQTNIGKKKKRFYKNKNKLKNQLIFPSVLREIAF